MVVITLTVTPSSDELISGIPKTVTMTTNVAAVIFYTLDGTAPTTASNVYTSAITLPTNQSSVTLKAFATNGTDNSALYSNQFGPDISHIRVSHAKATVTDVISHLAPGSRGDTPITEYAQPSDDPMDAANVTPVDQDGYGYEPSIYPVREYDAAIPTYDLTYSESNWKGEMGADIGTLPAQTTIVYSPPPPEEAELNRATYDPRALVTFHDGTQPNANENTIFRPYYDGEDLEKAMYGTRFSTTNMKDGDMGPNGSLVNQIYNPRDNTITFYYRDNRCNRWIISKENIKSTLPNPRQQNPLYNFISPSIGDGHVYRWMLFKGTSIV